MFTKEDRFLVTGATSGIGRATTLKLLELGAFVIAFGRNSEKIDSLKSEATNDRLIVIEKDLSKDLDELSKDVLVIAKEYGKIKGCLLSAGVLEVYPLRMSKEQSSKELFNINYFSSFFMAKAFCDKRVNIGEGSSLVFLSSISSITGNSGITNYSASKGAINSLVKSLAMEVSKQKIRVNSILPGTVKTEMVDNCVSYTDDYLDEIENNYPLGLGTTEDIVEPIIFLLSDKSKWITGTNMVVDGGASL